MKNCISSLLSPLPPSLPPSSPSPQAQTTLSTNDIVINKLTQILSYLRQGMRVSGKKGKKRDKGQATPPAHTYCGI